MVSNHMGNHSWEQRRVIHNMLRWEQSTRVQALAGERSADGYHVHSRCQCRLHTSRRIFDHQTIFRLYLQFSGQQEIDLWIRLAMFDIVPCGNKIERTRQTQHLEDTLYLVMIRHCCQADTHTGVANFLYVSDVMQVPLAQQQRWIVQHIRVDTLSHLDKDLPGSTHTELCHTCLSCALQ